MPGTTMLHAYDMELIDALAILLAGGLHCSPHEADELRRAARSVVEARATEVAERYINQTEPKLESFRIVQGGKHDA